MAVLVLTTESPRKTATIAVAKWCTAAEIRIITVTRLPTISGNIGATAIATIVLESMNVGN